MILSNLRGKISFFLLLLSFFNFSYGTVDAKEFQGFQRNKINFLVRAMQEEDDAKLKLLLESGEHDVNMASKQGYTALMYASYVGRDDWVALLIQYGADVHQRAKGGITALGVAEFFDKEEVIKVLRSNGALQ